MNRANKLRQNCEFDRAAEIYDRVLSNVTDDSEVYWSLVLCRYGIEYVDDPVTHKRIPTCHRTQFNSILNDADYLSALKYADVLQKAVYEEEAQYIDTVQKGILEISNKEEPFDVFICYKETDDTGRRTQDSVLAQELYYGLTNDGFKVFFSRITLEGKLGTAYEPYIFAALNSAKVMVVVGTKPEYYNAVWVKNEWARFLAMMQDNREKTIIPAYKDMDPYDLPDELSMFQAQDMSKLGFMQDLTRGIKKIVKGDEATPQAAPVYAQPVQASSNVENLLKRGMLSLEDGKWGEANGFFEQVLNENAEEPRAYIGKLLAEYHLRREEDLNTADPDFERSVNFAKIMRFGDAEVQNRFNTYVLEAKEKAEFLRVDGIYKSAVGKATKDNATIEDYQSAIADFYSIIDYKDSQQQVERCKQKIKELQELEEHREIERQKLIAAEKRRKRIIAISSAATVAVLLVAVLMVKKVVIPVVIPNAKYSSAGKLADKGEYLKAVSIYTELGDFKDSQYKNTKIVKEHSLEVLPSLNVGDSVYFGNYGEPVEWRILEKNDDSVLVISKNILKQSAYNEQDASVTWETCTLRQWLNNDLYNYIFSDEEKALIKDTVVINGANAQHNTPGGNNTTDKLFLLSLDEAQKYFADVADRATTFEDSSAWWWLRSPGINSSRAAYVHHGGAVLGGGTSVGNADGGVRPAVWIKYKQ